MILSFEIEGVLMFGINLRKGYKMLVEYFLLLIFAVLPGWFNEVKILGVE